MDNNMRIDLHMHTSVSDGTDSPEEIISRVREAGIGLFAVTDHDAVKGCRIISEVIKDTDPLFIRGVEFSCKDEDGKYHILGYNYNTYAYPILHLVELGHKYRMNKVERRLEFIKDNFGFVFRQEDLIELFLMDNPGKPHIANLMVKYGYAKNKKEAIYDYIDKLRFHTEYVRPEQAITGIIEGGGIPVLAHPSYGSGDQIIIGEEMDKRLRRLINYGLKGVEAFYSGFPAKLTEEMLSYAEKYNLYVTAGSDYHGTNKLVTLGDNGLKKIGEGPEGLKRFLKDLGL